MINFYSPISTTTKSNFSDEFMKAIFNQLEDCGFDNEATVECEYAIPEVEQVFFNGRHTTVVWEDGEKTTVGCMKNEPFDEYAGFAAAVLKKLFGSSTAAKRYLDERKVVQQEKIKKEKKSA